MRTDFCVVTTYFNPCGYKTRKVNYEKFLEGLKRQGARCLTVECAFGDEPFELEASPDVLQVRSDSVLWQKERLINIGVEALPPSYKYIAWIDADVLFENDDWVADTVTLLKKYKVAQLFTGADRLDQHGNSINDTATSFAAIAPFCPETVCCGRYDLHGHTGYAWAMRREIFDKVGLYTGAVSGSSDHFMAHAIYDVYGFCVENALKHDQKQISHLQEWGKHFYDEVQESLVAVPGRIVHLWHGDLQNRRYFLRMHEITDLGYDPYTDVQFAPGQPASWTSTALKKPGLASYFHNYFAQRAEDGVAA